MTFGTRSRSLLAQTAPAMVRSTQHLFLLLVAHNAAHWHAEEKTWIIPMDARTDLDGTGNLDVLPGWSRRAKNILAGHSRALEPRRVTRPCPHDLSFLRCPNRRARFQHPCMSSPILTRRYHGHYTVLMSGEKMGKSLGRTVTIRDVLNTHSTEALLLGLLPAVAPSKPIPWSNDILTRVRGQRV